MHLNVFNQNLKELHERFLHMMGVITSFEKNNFIINIVDYGLKTKSLGCTFEEGGRENKIVKRQM